MVKDSLLAKQLEVINKPFLSGQVDHRLLANR